jgi:hypothetical protein
MNLITLQVYQSRNKETTLNTNLNIKFNYNVRVYIGNSEY